MDESKVVFSLCFAPGPYKVNRLLHCMWPDGLSSWATGALNLKHVVTLLKFNITGTSVIADSYVWGLLINIRH